MLCTDRAELLSAAVLSDTLLRDVVLFNRLRSEFAAGNRHNSLLRGQVQNSERQSAAALQVVVDRFVLQPLRFCVLRALCSIM
jgi:hypothetical protein